MAPDRAARKRQRTEANEEDTKKQRGRPRVEGQDETAADRRRTQIRLAQRAYRQRKETTIASLKGQVSTLQSTLEEMENTFLAFNDKAVASGVLNMNPALARELKKATEAFIQLAKRTHHSSDEENTDSESDGVQRDPIGSYQADVAMVLGRENDAQQNMNMSSSPEPQELPRKSVDIGLGYIQVFDSLMSSNSSEGLNTNGFGSPMHSDEQHNYSKSSMGIDFPIYSYTNSSSNNDILAMATSEASLQNQQLNLEITTPSLTQNRSSMVNIKSPPAPYTYSFQEITFARRLQRAALERGFHLISSAETRPTAFLRVFRLSLLYHTREALLGKFRRSLSRSTEESLETFQTPFIHLGGAGMHYNTGRVRNGYIVKPGPLQAQATLESVDAPGSVVDIEFDLNEYEGEWFDSNDVEGYLLEKGLQIDPQSSFAEGHITVSSKSTPGASVPSPISSSPAPSHSDVDMSPSTPVLDELALDLGAQRLFPELGDSHSSNELWDATAAGWLMGSGDKTPDFLSSGWLGVQQPADWDLGDAVGSSSVWYAEQPRAVQVDEKRNVTIDVSKFIDELIKSGICLGRAPGFRKRDVDLALHSAIIQVF